MPQYSYILKFKIQNVVFGPNSGNRKLRRADLLGKNKTKLLSVDNNFKI